MKVDLKAIEALAPDQPSLKTAAGLTKPAKWSGASVSAEGQLIWAACAGSGANPYRVIADVADLGSKCTCPSRKFPCKHALACCGCVPTTALAFYPAKRLTGSANGSGDGANTAKDKHNKICAKNALHFGNGQNKFYKPI